uniref:Uncharacterized protein n=1 Tax=Neogobius melanostomus TaxID=47308 RepID=A0A8C6S4J3_9GOBI
MLTASSTCEKCMSKSLFLNINSLIVYLAWIRIKHLFLTEEKPLKQNSFLHSNLICVQLKDCS